MKNKRMNAIPESYRAYYIEPGLADYTAEGIGVVLVQKPALDAMMSTYVGKPVVNLEHTDLEPEELFNMSVEKVKDFADGVIAAAGYDAEKGWYWTDMMIWDEETLKNIKNGFSVSCAYDVTEADEKGGTYHNVPYDEEVLKGEALHMAIVPNPRYEQAWIIKNSKSEEDNLKIVFKKKDKKAPVEKKTVKNMEPEKKKDDEETMENMTGYVENEKGEQVPIEELANMYREKMATKNSGKKYNADDEVTVDGKKMTVREMMSAIEEEEEIENAEPAQTDDAEEVIDETKQMNNSTVKNENFNKVKNAAGKEDKKFKPQNLNTISERLTRGNSRYGTAVAQGGK